MFCRLWNPSHCRRCPRCQNQWPRSSSRCDLRFDIAYGTPGMVGTGGLWKWGATQLRGWRWVILGSRWPGHVQMRGTAEGPGRVEQVGRGVLWEWGAAGRGHGGRVVVKRRQGGYFQRWETAEDPGRLGQVRQLGQGSVVGLLAPQLALAQLGHLRQLGQGVLPEGRWCERRRVAPGRGDRGWYRGHEPGRPGPRHRTCAAGFCA